MVFSSIPAYLDPPNWQPINHQVEESIHGGLIPQLIRPPEQEQPQAQPQGHGGGGPGLGSIRPGSMADRARMANIPMPEAALKCPRCESTNTKFCYFNNYSLSQPRHFCKTCRRYWTRGGALRSVPVGGGCRRNKRSSKGSNSNSSKSSPATSTGDLQTAPSGGSIANTNPSILGLTSQIPQLRFMAPLSHQLPHHEYGTGDQIGLNYGVTSSAQAVATNTEMNFHIGSNLFGGAASVLYPFQGQQFQILGGLIDQSGQASGVYSNSYHGGTGVEASGYAGEKLSNSMISQLASVKMEDHNHNNQDQSNRQFMGVFNQGHQGTINDQWSGSAWTDLSGFSSSSTSNPL